MLKRFKSGHSHTQKTSQNAAFQTNMKNNGSSDRLMDRLLKLLCSRYVKIVEFE